MNIEGNERVGTAYRFMMFMQGRTSGQDRFFTSSELKAAGLYGSDVLQLMIDQGVIERLDTGYYRLTDFAYDVAARIGEDEYRLVTANQNIQAANDMLSESQDVRHTIHWGKAPKRATSDGYPYGWGP